MFWVWLSVGCYYQGQTTCRSWDSIPHFPCPHRGHQSPRRKGSNVSWGDPSQMKVFCARLKVEYLSRRRQVNALLECPKILWRYWSHAPVKNSIETSAFRRKTINFGQHNLYSLPWSLMPLCQYQRYRLRYVAYETCTFPPVPYGSTVFFQTAVNTRHFPAVFSLRAYCLIGAVLAPPRTH